MLCFEWKHYRLLILSTSKHRDQSRAGRRFAWSTVDKSIYKCFSCNDVSLEYLLLPPRYSPPMSPAMFTPRAFRATCTTCLLVQLSGAISPALTEHYSADRWEPKQSIARYTSPLTNPPGEQLGHPGLPAQPTTSPRAFGLLKTVSALLGKCTRELRQPRGFVIADRTPQGSAAPRLISTRKLREPLRLPPHSFT